MIPYVLWDYFRDIYTFTLMAEPWEAFVHRFSQHVRYATKEEAKGFSPYTFAADIYCPKHGEGPHRCDSAVGQMTLAVFDADAGPIADCRAELDRQGIAYLFYSTYNHAPPEKSAFRLVLPISEPIHPGNWPTFRDQALRRYRVPSTQASSSGRSHFHYIPSCPEGATPEVYVGTGHPVDVKAFALPDLSEAPKALRDWTPAEFTGPLEVAPLVEEIRATITRWLRGSDPNNREKAHRLKLVLEGAPLAGPKERNNTLLSVSGTLAWLLPLTTPPQMIVHILRPSFDAMVAEGSRVTEEELLSMVIRGQEKKAAHVAADAERQERLRQNQARANASLFDHFE